MKKCLLALAIVFVSLYSFSQTSNVGIGTNDPRSKLDVQGGLSLREGTAISLAAGNNDNVALPGNYSFYRIVAPTGAAFAIVGIVPGAGADGQVVTLVNTTTQVMTIKNNASGTAANSIRTLTGNDIVSVAGGSSVTFQYNKTEAKWYVTGSQNFTVTSGSIATSDIQPGTNSAVTVVNGTGKAVGTGNVVLDVTTNALNQKGIVSAPTGGDDNRVWGTDAGGNPGWTKVGNAKLTNSTVTVNTGSGLNGGGTVALGGTLNLTNTAPDQTVVLTNGSGISATGTYPNFTIANTGDINAADDVTTGSAAGGDLSGTFSNLQINSGTVGTTEITDGSIAAGDLSNLGAGTGQSVYWNGSGWVPYTPSTGTLTGNGTVNYLPKWTSATNLSSTSSIYDNGNVGIGNNNPLHPLHVGVTSSDIQPVAVRGYNNNGSWKGGAAFGYTSASVILGELSGVAQIGGHSPTLNAWADLLINQGGRIGLGTPANINNKIQLMSDGNTQAMQWNTSGYIAANTWGTQIYKQDVGGGIPLRFRTQSASTWYDGVDMDHGQDNGHPSLRSYYNTQLATAGGNVGIGNTNPSYKLDVAGGKARIRRGAFTMGNDNEGQLEISNTGTGDAFISFHREGVWGAHLGLEADNWLTTRGWSAGAGGWTSFRTGSLQANGTGEVTGNFTAPVMYDYNNVGYYMNPNGLSRMSTITLDNSTGAHRHFTYGGVFAGDWQTLTNTEGQLNYSEVHNITGGGHSNHPTTVYPYGGVLSFRGQNHSFQLYAAHTGDLAYKTQWGNDNYSGWRTILTNTNIGTSAIQNQYSSPQSANFMITGTGRADGDFRSPIFYDQNNTAFYTDPHSTSMINKVRADNNGALSGHWSHDPYGYSWGAPHGSFRSLEVSSSGNFDTEPAMFRIHQWGSGAAEFWKPKGQTLYLRETPGGGGGWFTTFELQGFQRVTRNIHVSTGGATGEGLYLADDGSMVDNNDGYASMRFSYGLAITSGNNQNTQRILLRNDGNIQMVNNGSPTLNFNDSDEPDYYWHNNGDRMYLLHGEGYNGWNGNRPLTAYQGNKIGINEISPSRRFQVNGADMPSMKLQQNGTHSHGIIAELETFNNGAATQDGPRINFHKHGAKQWAIGVDPYGENGFSIWEDGSAGGWGDNSKFRVLPGTGQTKVIVSAGGSYYTDWPGGWGGGFSSWDMCVASIRYSGLSSRSDVRLKKNIEPVADNALAVIGKLRPVTYNWIDEKLPQRKIYGFIAQEIQEVLPEIVEEGGDEQKTLGMSYQDIIPIQTKAIQELMQKIEKLEKEIEELKRK